MRKQERAALIQKLLNHYFPDPPIPLHFRNSYTLLIAVLLSARSTDAMVNKVTPKLFAHAETAEEMIKLDEEEIRKIIRPCGLSPQKARAILGLSQILVEKFNGEVPQTFEELESLPGVGHKTASVVLAQAFKIPAFPVDTHIFRCARRWGLSKGKSVTQVEKDLRKIFPKEEWIRIHLQIIYYARRFCPARCHHIKTCPICLALE